MLCAFRGCKSLEVVTIPESVMSIEDLAFEDCSRLVVATIPRSVKDISDNAFKGCSPQLQIERETLKKGSAVEQFELGQRYAYGDGMVPNASEAERCWRNAAEQGFAPAQTCLGCCAYAKRNLADAVEWWRKAAKQNHAEAQYLLGHYHPMFEFC